jgi:hypothetical protein
MRCPVVVATTLLLTFLGAAPRAALHAQVASAPFPAWTGEQLAGAGPPNALARRPLPLASLREGSTRRSHTRTGLLIGGLIGVAATTVFLVGFCGDPDTACGADEVGRAVVLIAVPCAAAGALIGSLIHTEQ